MPLFEDYKKMIIDEYKSDNNIDNKIQSLLGIYSKINNNGKLHIKDKLYLLKYFNKIYKSTIIQKLNIIKDCNYSEVSSYMEDFHDTFSEINKDKILDNRNKLGIIEYLKKMYKSTIAQKFDDFIAELIEYLNTHSTYPIIKKDNIVSEINTIYVMEDSNSPIPAFKKKIIQAYEKLLLIMIKELEDKLTNDQKKDLIVLGFDMGVQSYLEELIFNPNFSKEMEQEYPEYIKTKLQAMQFSKIQVLNPNLQECIKAEFGTNDINTILKVIANNQLFLIEVFDICKEFKIYIKDKDYALHDMIQALIVNNLNDIKFDILELIFSKMEEVHRINLDRYNDDLGKYKYDFKSKKEIAKEKLSLNSHRQYINQLLEYIILNKEDSTLSLNDKYSFLIKYYYFDFLENTKNANNKEKLTFEKFCDIYKSTILDKKHILDGW